jgi:trimethylamine--corrinoid protein Co-methyltransferase
MKSKPSNFEILIKDDIKKIHSNSKKVLEEVGFKVHNDEALQMLTDAGVNVDLDKKTVYIPEDLVENALQGIPSSFKLYDREAVNAIDIGGDHVWFAPGTTSVNLLDHVTGENRLAETLDCVKHAKLVDALEHLAMQCTSIVPSDVPNEVKDWYRLYINIVHSTKPNFTGPFTKEGFYDIKAILEAVAGGKKKLAEKPRAYICVETSSPLRIGEIPCQALMECSRANTPVEIRFLGGLGSLAPVTLVGSLVQQTAEFLGTLVIHQLVNFGAPVIWCGTPALFDMRYGTPILSGVETLMMETAMTQIGKYYKIPTGVRTLCSSTKTLDAETGMESGIGLILSSLSGTNIIQGPGQMGNANLHSLLKLVIDHEICGMAYHLLDGININDDAFAFDLIKKVGPGGTYFLEKHTKEYLRKEIYYPSKIIDRQTLPQWKRSGSQDVIQRSRKYLGRILTEHKSTPLDADIKRELDKIVKTIMKRYGISSLPIHPFAA